MTPDEAIKNFRCPRSMVPHCRTVLQGEYDVPGLELEPGAVVLDIGANVGAFTLWALKRWPGCIVRAYEPNPEAFAGLLENTAGLEGVHLHQVAVCRDADEGIQHLYLGKNNLGEASLWHGPEQRAEYVEVLGLRPDALPECAVLKMDTEGTELEIWEHYTPRTPPRAVMFEFHDEDQRIAMDRLLAPSSWASNYSLVRGHISSKDRGTLCYLRST